MAGWLSFWKIVLLVGFGAFYLLVLAIIPLGARDLVRLFRHLGRGDATRADEE